MGYGLVTSLYKYRHKKPIILNSKSKFTQIQINTFFIDN